MRTPQANPSRHEWAGLRLRKRNEVGMVLERSLYEQNGHIEVMGLDSETAKTQIL